jgi:hypothetical protein
MDTKGIGKNNLQKYCAVLARDFPFDGELSSSTSFALRTSDRDADGNLLPDVQRITAIGKFLR